MRTGRPGSPRGFTYLGLLFALALGGVALAAIGERWQLAAQREREAELLFRGSEIRVALERYAAATAAGAPPQPQTLQDLVHDTRGPAPRHWLRRLYVDPFSGSADWRLLRNAEGGITGVASSAQRPALRRHGLPDGVTLAAEAPTPLRVGDWEFIAGSAAVAAMAIKPRTNTTTPREPR